MKDITRNYDSQPQQRTCEELYKLTVQFKALIKLRGVAFDPGNI